MRRALLLVLFACTSNHPARRTDSSVGPDSTVAPPDVVLASVTAHNTSASDHYDRVHFAANFGTSTWITQAGATMPVDPDRMDLSLNPVTPAHVSSVDVHALVPSRPDLRWFAHVVPWFGNHSHVDIGVDNNTDAWVAAMLEDVRRRGFDGIVINWYGHSSYENEVTLKIQAYLHAHPGLTIALMLDKGIPNLSASTLAAELAYCRQQYFGDAIYEKDGSKPIVMFFGVTSVVGDAGMAQAKGNAAEVWVTQGAGALATSWVDQSFDWTHDWHDGVPASDPYNLAGVRAYYGTVKSSPKKAWGAMTGGFNGMLTKSVAWSKGKYLPGGDGVCVAQWAKTVDAVIPANVTRMQWVTWNDWEEGSAGEPGVENAVAVTARVDRDATTGAAMLRWDTTGDEQTIDHDEIYATADGVMAWDLGAVPPGTHELALPATPDAVGATGAAGMHYVVDAVGKPMIRDHASAPTE